MKPFKVGTPSPQNVIGPTAAPRTDGGGVPSVDAPVYSPTIAWPGADAATADAPAPSKPMKNLR